MCFPSKTLWPIATLKGCKWGYWFFTERVVGVSFFCDVQYIADAKFEEHCLNIFRVFECCA